MNHGVYTVSGTLSAVGFERPIPVALLIGD